MNKNLPSVYVKNDSGTVIVLNGTREAFKMRQRGIHSDGSKVKSFHFISWKEMEKKQKVIGPFMYSHKPKL
jgi:hypothetical protein